MTDLTTTPETTGMSIGGEERQARSGETMPVLAPATGATIAHVPAGGAADVELAVAAAKRAFDDGPWARMPAAQRARVLHRLADLIDERLPELYALETANNGRPIVETRAQLGLVAELFRYNASLAVTQRTDVIDIGADYLCYLQRAPLGVCAVIAPFNHPLVIMARGVAPALAAGNTVVVKPSELTPLTALAFARLAAEAGVPDGVVNVVTGLGLDVGAPLTEHPDVAKVDFTGGVNAGRAVAVAAARRFATSTTELGGKSPVLVFDDAGVERAARGIAFAGFIASGQTCICGSRLLVQETIYDEFLAALVAHASAIRIGDPADEATQMGPLISADARDRAARYTEIGVGEGAHVALGGREPELPAPFDGGFYFSPTILAGARNEMRCAQEEIFGPVLVVAPFGDEQDALRQANDIPFGLGAAIWTRDVARAHRVAKQIRSGMVWVNDHHRAGPSMPWGGLKDSGSGKQAGKEAFDGFTSIKSVIVKPSNASLPGYGDDAHDRLN